MIVDLHVKTKASDGTTLELTDVLKAAKEANLDGIAICETLSSAKSKDVVKAAKAEGLTAFVGVEIPTDSGILMCFPPSVDKFLTGEKWSELTEFGKPSAKDVIAMVEGIGGVVIAARPYDVSVAPSMGDQIFELSDAVVAVEVFNSRIQDIQADFALEAARVLGKKTVGGSDPTSSKQVIGQFATLFKGEINSQKAFIAALKEGEYWAVRVGGKPARSSKPRSDRGDRRDDRGGRDKRGGDKRGGDRHGGGGGRRGGGGGGNRRR